MRVKRVSTLYEQYLTEDDDFYDSVASLVNASPKLTKAVAKCKELEQKINDGDKSNGTVDKYIALWCVCLKYGYSFAIEAGNFKYTLKLLIERDGAGVSKNIAQKYIVNALEKVRFGNFTDEILTTINNLVYGKLVDSIDSAILYDKGIYAEENEADVVYKLKAYANVANPKFVQEYGLFKRDEHGNPTRQYLTIDDFKDKSASEIQQLLRDCQTESPDEDDIDSTHDDAGELDEKHLDWFFALLRDARSHRLRVSQQQIFRYLRYVDSTDTPINSRRSYIPSKEFRAFIRWLETQGRTSTAR